MEVGKMRNISSYDKNIPNLIIDGEERWSNPNYTLPLRIKYMLASLVFYIISATIKIKITGFKGLLNGKNLERPVILAIWHSGLLLPTFAYRKARIVSFVSSSKDGDFLLKLLYLMGYKTIRGSSSRRGARGLLECIREVRDGSNAAFAVDGPRGPVYEAKPGIVALAQKTNAYIMPVGSAYARAHKSKKSWDKSEFPYPFSRAVMHVAEPFVVDKSKSTEEWCRIIEERLTDATNMAKLSLK
jgi:lysophospholipid acyltransferase (LPLAT)-like uncharacterized protein